MNTIVKRIKQGNALFKSSVHLLGTAPALWLYVALVTVLLYAAYTLIRFIPPILAIVIGSVFATSIGKVFIVACIIHQVIHIPSGIGTPYHVSIHACRTRLWPLTIFAVIESLIWVTCMISKLCAYRIAYIMIAIAWYTVTLPVIPLIIDNNRSFVESFQATMLIDKKIWVEALIGSLYNTLGISLLYYVMSYTTLQQTSIALGILCLLSALILVLEAVFKAMLYCHAERDRSQELSEVEMPYF